MKSPNRTRRILAAGFPLLLLLPRSRPRGDARRRPRQQPALPDRGAALVVDPESAGKKLASWAEEVGGYFVVRSYERVILRIPYATVDRVRPALEKVAETVVSYAPSALDVREELARTESGIASREESLRLVLGYVDQASVSGTLALEKEISALMSQLESLKGRRQSLLNAAAFARVEIVLSSQRKGVPERAPSSFAWINGSICTASSRRSCPMASRTAILRCAAALCALLAIAACVTPPTPVLERPAGFAPFEVAREYRAMSPEGVAVRVRLVKNEPAQSLAFWGEALKRHLLESGYAPLREGSFDAPAGKGLLFEWVAPVGGENWIYLTGIVVRRGFHRGRRGGRAPRDLRGPPGGHRREPRDPHRALGPSGEALLFDVARSASVHCPRRAVRVFGTRSAMI